MHRLLDKFAQYYQFGLGKYAGDFVRIKNGDLFFDFKEGLSRQPIGIRLLVSGICTTCLLVYQEEQGHFQIERMPTLEEDLENIDVFLRLCCPAQYKTRQQGYPDFPCCRFQPCYGLDHPNTDVGRDYRCLQQHKTQYHFAALHGDAFNIIYRVDSEEFWELVQRLDQEWNRTELSNGNRKWVSPTNGAEVRWKKNENETFHKYNFYIPPKLFSSKVEYVIPEPHKRALSAFYRLAWDYVKATYL